MCLDCETIRSSGDDGELIVGRRKFPRCFYYIVGQLSVELLDPRLDDDVLGVLTPVVSKKLNFRELVFDRENWRAENTL